MPHLIIVVSVSRVSEAPVILYGNWYGFERVGVKYYRGGGVVHG